MEQIDLQVFIAMLLFKKIFSINRLFVDIVHIIINIQEMLIDAHMKKSRISDTRHFSVRLPRDSYQFLADLAAAMKVPVAVYTRNIILEHLAAPVTDTAKVLNILEVQAASLATLEKLGAMSLSAVALSLSYDAPDVAARTAIMRTLLDQSVPVAESILQAIQDKKL